VIRRVLAQETAESSFFSRSVEQHAPRHPSSLCGLDRIRPVLLDDRSPVSLPAARQSRVFPGRSEPRRRARHGAKFRLHRYLIRSPARILRQGQLGLLIVRRLFKWLIRRRATTVVLCCSVALFVLSPIAHANPPLSQYQVKALFIL